MNQLLDTFRALHRAPKLLCLPNAWDAGSAKLFESAGATAIATTSAGVAWAQGYPDGRVMPAAVAIEAAKNIARVLRIPLSVDIEHGYADDAEAVAQHVMRLVDAGVVGINIEDGADAPALMAKKIAAIKNRAAQSGREIFINARTDVYLAGLAPEGARVDEALRRAALYAQAGADGIFVPGVTQVGDIAGVAAGTALPLNVLAWPGLAAAEQLQQLGVRRLSAGSGITQALWGLARGMAQDFLATGSSAPLAENAMGYAELQALFASR